MATFQAMCVSCLLAVLSISYPTHGQSGTPPVEPPPMLVLPPHLTVIVDYGGEPVLLFTQAMWGELSRLLWIERMAAVEVGADAAVQVAVVPWMDRVERAEGRLGVRAWVVPALAVVVLVEGLILVLR